MELPLNQITFSDAFAFLTKLPENSVDATVTSPPGWRKRRQLPDDHKLAKYEMGQEGNLAEYIAGMLEVFGQVHRVTKDGGSCWVHLPDTRITDDMIAKGSKTRNGYWPGELVYVTSHFVSMMRMMGWRHQSNVVWHKTNANHFAASRRPSDAHDTILVFSKSAEMYFDSFAAMEEADGPKGGTELRKCRNVWTHATESVNGQRLVGEQLDDDGFLEVVEDCEVHGRGRDGGAGPLFRLNVPATCTYKPVPRETIQATPGAIVARCIAASTSEHGNCPKCGKGWLRMVKKIDRTPNAKTRSMVEVSAGFVPDCKCNTDDSAVDVNRPVILDPFAGSGTTLLAADMLGRDFVGSELDPRFVAKIAPARVRGGVISCGRSTKSPASLP